MKKLVFLGIAGIIVFFLLAVNTQPASAYSMYCFDPDDGPMVCYFDYSPEEYCLLHLPLTAPAGSNPVSYWDDKSDTCYYYHDETVCAPNYNALSGFYKLYSPEGIFYDGSDYYFWINANGGCAASVGGTPSRVVIHDGSAGDAEIRTGEFNYEYGTCSGLCRISTTKMTPPAMGALDQLPYKKYKKAYVTILNEENELAQGTFRLCYSHEYNEKKNPAYFRFNGSDWSYYGGFWNLSRTKFCMYSTDSGNYVLAELGQN